ncbi:MAG TPA: indolepyruvate ferredoxin oxidoreductase family protein [Steroidobacteraceae bacterium]|jgi:indolepyruvate ferredoxin oxidoreductase
MAGQKSVSLDDKYTFGSVAFLSGRQALVRVPLLQRELDRRNGLNTAGLISGYRGSPLGGYDLELKRVQPLLQANQIEFQPGINEDLALSALSGAQQLGFVPGAKVDGVFGIWYGKGPGVDRSGDAIKHANLSGVARYGGILLAFGDDHTGKSSTTAHQSDLTLASYEVPILYPASVAEVVELGLAGIALSRFSGLVVGMKLVNETADGSAVVATDRLPEFAEPELRPVPGGVHIRIEPRALLERDARLVRHKLPRASAFARANRLDRISYGAEMPRLLIATAGKAYADVLSALHALHISDSVARQNGIGVYKIALIFPLDPAGLESASSACEEIFCVEEKRPHIETQAKQLLFHRPHRPRISGKSAPTGEALLPADMPLDAATVAEALAQRLKATIPDIEERIPGLAAAIGAMQACRQALAAPIAVRRPAFCPGCPHNTSTRVPEGSFGATGIGCHGMSLFHVERNPLPMGHMGAEGAQWIGMSPFSGTPHIFQNMGDGTYSHSGSLAIRAAVSAGTRITFKILLNDAVAMTGGQPVEGSLDAAAVASQLRAEGVSRVVVVAEDPKRWKGRLPERVELRHRDELDAVQRSLREHPGVSALIFDQTCAAEKRRRRKANAYPDPDRRLFINPLVCEGCGDCSAESNCLAVQPLQTELGRKRRIDQSACNKDFSCLKGFCPAFVSVTGARPKRPAAAKMTDSPPPPAVPRLDAGFDMIIAGVGGTGVLTVSALLAMAARLEGYGASVYDMTGLSQKGGQVFSHVRMRPSISDIAPARLGRADAHVVLACDLIAATQSEVMETLNPARTVVIANGNTLATADFQLQRDLDVPQASLAAQLRGAVGERMHLLEASQLAERMTGDSIAANVALLGYAWQLGAIPLSLGSIERAIELNGKGTAANLQAFNAGRVACAHPLPTATTVEPSLEEFVARRAQELCEYGNARYGARYATLMRSVQGAAARVTDGRAFAWAVARSAFKLMAYKDEYEVARLYTDGRFRQLLGSQFEAVRSATLHLAPPILARRDSAGRPRKLAFGPWIFPLLKLLAKFKILRETPLDPFGRNDERRLERELRDQYLRSIEALLPTLSADTLATASSLAAVPLEVRGFGDLKRRAAERALKQLRVQL